KQREPSRGWSLEALTRTRSSSSLVLICAEVKQFVFDYVAASVATDPIEIEARTLDLIAIATCIRLRFFEAVIECIVVFVLVVPPRVPMKVICTALRDGVELSGRRMAKLSSELVRKDGELLDRVLNRRDLRTSHTNVVIVDPVNCERVVARAVAADRSARTKHSRALCRDVGCQQCQCVHILTDRQLYDFAIFKALTEL